MEQVLVGPPRRGVVPSRSLAAMRRLVETPDVLIIVLEHWQERLRGTTRIPKRVQTGAYTFMAPNREGQVTEQWCYYPKASELRFNADGSVTFHPGTEKSWTLAFAVPIEKPPVKALPEADCQLDSRGVCMFHHVEHAEEK